MNNATATSNLTLLQSVFSSASEGILVVNRQGSIVMSNMSAETLFGYPKTELTGLKLEALMPMQYRGNHPHHREAYFKAPKSRKMGSGLDLFALRKDGKEIPVEISLSSFQADQEIFTTAFIIDISVRKEHERQLRENETRLKEYSEQLEKKVKERTQELEFLNLGLQSQVQERKIAESTLREAQKLYTAIAQNFPNGLISVLDLDYHLVFLDGRELSRRNWDQETLIGQSYPELTSYKETFNELLEGARNGHEFSQEFNWGDQVYQIHGVPLRDEENQVFQLLIVEENITAQKKVSEEIKKSLDRERELGVMKSRFVSMASHEFRTPLTTILSSANLIARYTDNQQAREKHVTRIKNSVQNLTAILNDFLSLEKLESGVQKIKVSDFDLTVLMTEVREEMNGLLKSGQEIQIEGPDLSLNTDQHILKNALVNLLSNAIKYSPENVPVKLRIDAKDQVMIAVTDQGIGIPEKDQPRLFERFHRAENATNIQGTGLGLHIVKKYLALLDGDIMFDSKENEGSTFTILLPNKK